MTLNELKTLHAYNSWATNRTFETLDQLTDEQYSKDMRTSHGSIKGTMVHLVGAEKIWLERFNEAPQPFLGENPPETVAELRTIWEQTGHATAKWLGMMNDRKLAETFSMKSRKGDQLTPVFWQAFQHVTNHSTYHRGQVVAMLRQIGVAPKGTDMILFFMETGTRG